MVSKLIDNELWSQQMLAEMKRKSMLDELRTFEQPILSLGPNIALTASQIDKAIADGSTDPIIRDALIAFKAKYRITGPPPVTIRADQVYGNKIWRVEQKVTQRGGK